MLSFDSKSAAEEVLSALVKEHRREDSSPAVILAGIQALATFLSEEAQAVVEKNVLKSKGERRLYALLALADRPAGGGEEVLLQVLQGKEPAHIAQAALALGRRQYQPALPHLLALLDHDMWQLRTAGARGLEGMAGLPQKDSKTGEEKLPPLPEWMDKKEVLTALAKSLESAEGRDRSDIIKALKRISLEDYGYDIKAWQKLAGGADPSTIRPRKVGVPTFCGVPIFGRRIVLIVDISTCTDDTHPFQDLERLKEVCKIPGARPVPWYEVRTTKQFFAAHTKRLLQDLPGRGQKFELIAVFQKIEPIFEKLAPCNSGTKRQAIKFLEELAIQGGPNHYDALKYALDISGTKDRIAWSLGPDEIILMTCAIPWAPADPNAMVGQTQVGSAIGLKARVRMVPVHTVGVGPHPYEMMKMISGQSGGTYVDYSM
jgi:hypothetical protein